jgi:hypothetical protein
VGVKSLAVVSEASENILRTCAPLTLSLSLKGRGEISSDNKIKKEERDHESYYH